MNSIKILNLVGLILNFSGAFIMWRFTPPAFRNAMIYADDKVLEDFKNQKRVRRGLFIMAVGFILQLIAIIISH